MEAHVGELSVHFERRWVLTGTSLTGAALAFAIHLLDPREPAIVILMIACLGGAMHTLYPVAVAHANDRASEGEYVAVASGLLLIFGAGSTLGPAIAAPVMQLARPSALFLFLACIYLAIAAHALWRTRIRPPVAEARTAFATGTDIIQGAMQGATQETVHLDPHAEEDEAAKVS